MKYLNIVVSLAALAVAVKALQQTRSVEFTQNVYGPGGLDTSEVYRHTKDLLAGQGDN